jgi:hypothetical protein
MMALWRIFFLRFHRYGIEGWEWVEGTQLVDKGRCHSEAYVVDHVLHGGGREVLVRCGEKLWRNFDYLTIWIWWCPRHCVCEGDFSIKDPVAEEVVVCTHTEDLFGGRNTYQGGAVFIGIMVDNATGGKISKGDRCREVQCRDVIKDDFGGKLPSGRPFRPDVHARPRLPRGRIFTVRQRGKNYVRAGAKKIKNKK